MNILEYVNDPKAAAQTNRETKAGYDSMLDDIIMREKKMPNVDIFTHNDTEYWFHIKVPDSKVHGTYYDVVFQFTPKNDAQKAGRMITEYDVKFFANDPGFIFYFCYVFNKNHLLIDSLKSKLNSRALNEPPKQTNPEERIRYAKTIYYGYLILNRLNLFDKEYIKLKHPSKLNTTTLLGRIKTDTHIRAKINTDRKIKGAFRKVNKKVNAIPSTIKKTVDTIVTKAVGTVPGSKGSRSSKTSRTVGKAKTTRTIGAKRRKR